jgi:S-adenosylmethionine:tRNA ribosyltransferase-isomerase
MHPKNLSIKDFTYDLPEDRISVYPLTERDASKLLIYKEGNITEDRYRNIAAHIPENAWLIFNNSKVVAARLLFQKPTGGTVEIFCLEPDGQYTDIATAMLQQGKVYWQCLVGGASKWKQGQVLEKKIRTGNEMLVLTASYKEKKAGYFVIELSWQPAHKGFAEVLHLAGAIPLPPYIKRNPEALDTERYQTIYARKDGSVAAPTAGLHFTPSVFKSLADKNINHDFITLHVGAGTFKPVKTDTMETHEMHAEFIDVSRELIENLLSAKEPVIAVGTTSLRALESLYWLGCSVGSLSVFDRRRFTEGGRQSLTAEGLPEAVGSLSVGQWDAYEQASPSLSSEHALESLLRWMDEHKTEWLLAKTQIIIAPGYQPRMAKALVTNFHQPQSTLLLLVAALAGKNWKKIYDYALENGFRFLSYGDGCLLWISP